MNLFNANHLKQTPNPTRGHHFSDYLTCHTRAWLDYYAEPSIKAPEPQYLKQSFIEGKKFESIIYSKDDYKDSITIPFNLSKDNKINKTNEAILSGKTRYIKQAYFSDGDTVGVADLLERVDFANGKYFYRVGEIKSTKELTLSHVLQLMWYDLLLKEIQGNSVETGFVILGNEDKHEIELKDYFLEFFAIKKELLRLRSITKSKLHLVPRPVFGAQCFSCAYRYECIPILLEQKDPSLVFGIGRKRIEEIRKYGVNTYEDFESINKNILYKIGFEQKEIRTIIISIKLLKENLSITKAKLDAEKLLALIPCSVLIDQNRVISEIFYSTDGKIGSVSVNNSSINWKDIPDIMKNNKLVFFGIDYSAFKKIKIESDKKVRLNTLDLFKIIENYLHVPFPGLDLYTISNFIKGYNCAGLLTKEIVRQKPIERIASIKNLINWLIRGTKREQELFNDYTE